jgi:hypothetical protein
VKNEEMTPLEILRFADSAGGLLAFVAHRESDPEMLAALVSDPHLLERVREAAEGSEKLSYVRALRRAIQRIDRESK